MDTVFPRHTEEVGHLHVTCSQICVDSPGTLSIQKHYSSFSLNLVSSGEFKGSFDRSKGAESKGTDNAIQSLGT